MKSYKVIVLYGGKSAEHEVSVSSAKNICASIDKKHEVLTVGIDKNGVWYKTDGVVEEIKGDLVTFFPGSNGVLWNITKNEKEIEGDVVFPVLHGPFGEDGTLQGFLDIVGVPYVGSKVIGSSVCMDKGVMKRLFKEAGLSVPKFIILNKTSVINEGEIMEKLGQTVFVKPANLGSSVGITKVKRKEDLMMAIKKAFEFDERVIIEEGVEGRELECSILGNDTPEASVVGEVKYETDFYSYDSKYKDGQGTSLIIPAELEDTKIKEIQEISKKAFKTTLSRGFARVDLFMRPNGEILINEINTIPGFTSFSMYPMLWKESGISYLELINKLLELALE